MLLCICLTNTRYIHPLEGWSPGLILKRRQQKKPAKEGMKLQKLTWCLAKLRTPQTPSTGIYAKITPKVSVNTSRPGWPGNLGIPPLLWRRLWLVTPINISSSPLWTVPPLLEAWESECSAQDFSCSLQCTLLDRDLVPAICWSHLLSWGGYCP